MDTVKNLPEYARLFGNKQGSESEEQYANKFKQAATNMFGADLGADTGGLQAGMAEGTTATTLGYLSGKTDAADSSKYQETLANAAMIIARLT